MPARPGTRRNSTALLAVASDRRRPRVDAGGTRLRLRALAVMGHGSARIARAAGVSDQAIQRLTRGEAKTVSPRLRDAVAAVYDAWWDKRAPERTRAERAAASAARRRAIRGNWCAGAALDEDELDIPGYRPAHGWRPARGTGIAADIHPAACEQRNGAGRMNDDHRQSWGLIIDVLDVLEKHGYRRGDDQHTGRAVGLVGDLARIYEGTQEAPAGAYVVVPEPSQASRDQAGRRSRASNARRSPPSECPPSCPRSMRPPTTSGTGRRAALTARTRPAEPASTASMRPAPTKASRPGSSTPSTASPRNGDPGKPPPARRANGSSPRPHRTERQANDYQRAKGTAGMKQRKDRIMEPVPGTRPPEYVIDLWAFEQLCERARRNAAALAETIQAEKEQDREPAQPELEDREAE